MPSTTTLQGLPYPLSSDSPAGNTQILVLANAVEQRVVMAFASSSARTTAFTNAGVTALEGMLCWLEDVNRYDYYTGSTWRPLTELGAGTGAELAYNEITSATSEITTEADVGPSISFTLAVTRKVLLRASFLFRSTAGADTMRGLITDASNTQLIDTGTIAIAGANLNDRREISIRKSLGAGSYTYKMRAMSATSVGTTIVSASATNPTFIQAIDLGP
jgi:hypothetical protein